MHKSFLNIICDPHTRENLELEIIKQQGEFIIEGILISKSSRYMIQNGIPRFLKKNEDLKQSFGFQWKKWNKLQFEDQNIGLPMEGHTRKMFLDITNFHSEINSGKTFLDIGSGSGRFADLLVKNNNKVICIDISNSVDQIYENLSKYLDKTLIIQCNFEKLPLKEESIDHAFSIGVLHHSRKPQEAFPETYRVLKNNGSFAVSVYSKDSPYNLFSVLIWRKIFNYLKFILSFYPIVLYAIVFVNIYYQLAKIINFRGLGLFTKYSIFPALIYKDKNWSILDTFDLLSPKYASSHTNKEVIEWFEKNNFKNLVKSSWANACYKGLKKNKS